MYQNHRTTTIPWNAMKSEIIPISFIPIVLKKYCQFLSVPSTLEFFTFLLLLLISLCMGTVCISAIVYHKMRKNIQSCLFCLENWFNLFSFQINKIGANFAQNIHWPFQTFKKKIFWNTVDVSKWKKNVSIRWCFSPFLCLLTLYLWKWSRKQLGRLPRNAWGN